MKQRIVLGVSLIVLGMGLFSTAPVWALSVSPARTEAILKPGKSIKAEMKVTNETQVDQYVEVSTKTWFMLDANKNLKTTWLKIKGPNEFILKPGKTRVVPLKLSCPKEAQGELVGMVSYQYMTNPPSMVTPIISAAVYVAADGRQTVAGEIDQLVLYYWKHQLRVAVVVKATGNVHLRPTGQVMLYDESGKFLIAMPIPESDPVYPGRQQGYFAQPPDLHLKPGRYKAHAELHYRDLSMQMDRGFTVAADGKIHMDNETPAEKAAAAAL